MRMHGEVGHGVDLAEGDVGIVQALDQFLAAQRSEHVADDLVGEGPVADAFGDVGEARIIRQVGQHQDFGTELLPLALALD